MVALYICPYMWNIFDHCNYFIWNQASWGSVFTANKSGINHWRNIMSWWHFWYARNVFHVQFALKIKSKKCKIVKSTNNLDKMDEAKGFNLDVCCNFVQCSCVHYFSASSSLTNMQQFSNRWRLQSAGTTNWSSIN